MDTYAYKFVTKVLSRALRTPQYLILFVSDACWMKCKHCWFNEDWKEKNLTNKSGGVIASDIDDRRHLIKTENVDYRQLTYNELENLADSINGISFVSITGGEAYMRKDLVDIVTMFRKKAKMRRCAIPTSGYVPDMIVDKTEKILLANPGMPFRTDVSLDGPKDLHEGIRGVRDVYERAIETIRELNKLKAKYSYFDVGVITTLSKGNQDRVDEIAEIVEGVLPGGEWMINITRGEPRDPISLEVDPEIYLKVHKSIASKVQRGEWGGHSGHSSAQWLSAKNATKRKIIYKTITGGIRGGGCAAGALSGVIFSDGTVMPCELLEQGDHTFGNIRDFNYDLGALWNSPQADRVRAWIQDSRCICTQECFLSTSILIQPQHWPDMIYERIKLISASRNININAS